MRVVVAPDKFEGSLSAGQAAEAVAAGLRRARPDAEVVPLPLGGGARELVLGIGGSATTDGGAGMAAALGARLLDRDGADLPPGGAALLRLARIDTSGLDPRLRSVRVTVASDVDNPLVGPEGAA